MPCANALSSPFFSQLHDELEIMSNQITTRCRLSSREAKALGRMFGLFWGSHQRFFNQVRRNSNSRGISTPHSGGSGSSAAEGEES